MIHISHFLRYDKKVKIALFIGLLLAAFIVAWVLNLAFRPRLLKVSFYDIGQGDSIFIETPGRFQILIDGGPGPQVVEKIAADMPFYDRSLDLLISSHPDADHISGLIDILERYVVKMILVSPSPPRTLTSQRFYKEAGEEKAVVKTAVKTEKMVLPGEVALQLLNPLPKEASKTTNDNGVVAFLEYNRFRLLLLADVSSSVERKIMPFVPQGINVVKIAHHGSKYSSDREFLRHISPQLCVIQVGENRYGHPTKEALQSIAASGCQLWRTDMQGTLTLLTDGEKYWIK